MNIKIVDPLPSHLVAFKIPFGSRVYGTNSENSDHDYVVVTKSFNLGDATLQWSGMMAGEKVDLTYVDRDYLFEASEDGTNTVMFEAMHFRRKDYYLTDVGMMKDLYNYENAKAYLGLAKRDLDYPDRIFHVNRCLYMAVQIMNKQFIDLSKIKDIYVETNTELLKNEIKERREQLMKMRSKT